MAANPRLVANDTWVYWDLVMTYVPAGTVVDIPEGHDLEAAYGGLKNLVPLGSGVSYVVAEPEQPQPPEIDAGSDAGPPDDLVIETSPDFPPDDQVPADQPDDQQQAPPADDQAPPADGEQPPVQQITVDPGPAVIVTPDEPQAGT